MTARCALMALFAAGALGCTAGMPAVASPASGSFVTHGDAGSELSSRGHGFVGTADLGFEATGCCGGALYVSDTNYAGAEAKHKNAGDVLDGGLELSVVVPRIVNDRLRLRVRAGKSGTPPSKLTLGRSGYSTSSVVLFRLTPPEAPALNAFSPSVDLFAGMATTWLDKERTTYGVDDSSGNLSRVMFLFGVRLGVGYGVDLR